MNADSSIAQRFQTESKDGGSAVCWRCGTELRVGSEFCHVCGRWVFGSGLSRMMSKLKSYLKESKFGLPVAICMAAAALSVVISLFVGIRITPRTIAEWQLIQYWRIEWLLAAIVLLLFGVLLKRGN